MGARFTLLCFAAQRLKIEIPPDPSPEDMAKAIADVIGEYHDNVMRTVTNRLILELITLRLAVTSDRLR